MLRTEVIDSPFRGMGEALLRMAERRGYVADDRLRLMMSALMKGFCLAEAEGSVCVSREDVARLMTAVPDEAEGAVNGAPAASISLQEERLYRGAPDGEALRAVDEGVDALEAMKLLTRVTAGMPVVASPLVLDQASGPAAVRLYAARYFVEECRLACKLLSMAKTDGDAPTLSVEMLERIDRITSALNPHPEDHNPLQKKAVEMALTHRLTVISGGPGTGKTTTVGLILECLLSGMAEGSEPLRVSLAAPTGKATGRMRQSIQDLTTDPVLSKTFLSLRAAERQEEGARAVIESRTIHKWLSTNTASGERPSRENPLDADLLIVDEASMIDVHLAARLFDAVGDRTRVIVLGDKFQLAAVGPGAVFADISRSTGGLASVTVRLEKSRRFAEGSPIAEIAKAINHDGGMRDGEALRVVSKRLQPMSLRERAVRLGKSEEQVLESIRRQMAEEAGSRAETGGAKNYALAAYPDVVTPLGFSETARVWIDVHLSVYCEALVAYLRDPSPAALKAVWDSLMDFRPLCAHRHGPQSVSALNAYMIDAVQARLSAEGLLPEDRPGSCWPGAVVIVRQNDDLLGVYNGDVGVVLPVRQKDGTALMTIFGDSGLEEGRGVRLPPSLLPRHDPAFAMTIHQSQGSEFRHVAVFLPPREDSPLATRELLYTGVTRTRDSMTIFGSTAVLTKAVKTATTRVSGLAARLDG